MKLVLKRVMALSLMLAGLAACENGGGTGVDTLNPVTGVNVTTTATTATVTFTAVNEATGYVVERAPGNGGTFAQVGTTATTSYTDNGLSAGTSYRYRVAATRGSVRGDFSEPAMAVTPTLGEVTLTADITANRTLFADSTYVLGGFIHVNAGATLTIQAGTTIKGIPNSALFIMRGAQIDANGTAERPIVMTSSRPVGQREPGDWGGLIIIGGGQINRAGNIILEGTGTNNTTNDTIFYSGGTAAGDAGSSGRLRYVRIEFAGFGPLPDAELNSLTLAGVGSGTSIEYVQSLAGLDDSFEWFGGAVDGKYLVSYESGDDHFDASEGYRGRNQYLIALQDTLLPPRPGAGNTSNDPQGFENDGCGSNSSCPAGFNSTPLNTPFFANFTLVGTGPNVVATGGGIGMLLRRGTGGFYVNGIIARWPNAAISIRDQATFDKIAAGELMMRNMVLAENGATFQGGNNQFSVDAAANAITTASGATGGLFTAFPTRPAAPTLATLDWTPSAASPARTAGTGAFTGVLASRAGGFVTGTSYAGAADPTGAKWWAGWTNYARR